MRTQDERTMAMLAHGSAILNLVTGIGGIIVALVIYFMQKEKSAWVAFQALQSAVFQIIVVVVVSILSIISVLLIAVGIGCICLPISLILGLAGVAYSCYAAYVTNQGQDFKYIWLGDMLAGQMPPSGPTPPAGPTGPIPPAGPTTPTGPTTPGGATPPMGTPPEETPPAGTPPEGTPPTGPVA